MEQALTCLPTCILFEREHAPVGASWGNMTPRKVFGEYLFTVKGYRQVTSALCGEPIVFLNLVQLS